MPRILTDWPATRFLGSDHKKTELAGWSRLPSHTVPKWLICRGVGRQYYARTVSERPRTRFSVLNLCARKRVSRRWVDGIPIKGLRLR